MKKRIVTRIPKRGKLKPKSNKSRKNPLMKPGVLEAALPGMLHTLGALTIGNIVMDAITNPNTKLRPLEECSDKIDGGEHRWVVYSTAVDTKRLMLRCVLCGDYAEVADSTPEEWSAAFYSPSKPYIWDDHSRVILDPDS